MLNKIVEKQQGLSVHPVYGKLQHLPCLRLFMQSHVFAVWDFMSLLKSLQRQLSGVDLPWRPASCSRELTRLINEIVLAEESDFNSRGQVLSHFEMYLQAMEEVGASTVSIRKVLQDLDLAGSSSAQRAFVSHHLQLAQTGSLAAVAGSFVFGREKLIPAMFEGLLKYLAQNKESYPELIHYLERHIFLDGEDHGPKALSMVKEVCGDDQKKWQEAYAAALTSLELRENLWNEVLNLYSQDFDATINL